ncbi:hypothetical protein CEXT_497891 [Caerostris extrusa]|uniref:Uncharacterized protein n=1 Tax=Caerostris extrusa TaxID=172846 RepID=A0AAV4MC54_CAEEX|nr:hypothetical protein CEXT_497891 [Caerostris extrusa]
MVNRGEICYKNYVRKTLPGHPVLRTTWCIAVKEIGRKIPPTFFGQAPEGTLGNACKHLMPGWRVRTHILWRQIQYIYPECRSIGLAARRDASGRCSPSTTLSRPSKTPLQNTFLLLGSFSLG